MNLVQLEIRDLTLLRTLYNNGKFDGNGNLSQQEMIRHVNLPIPASRFPAPILVPHPCIVDPFETHYKLLFPEDAYEHRSFKELPLIAEASPNTISKMSDFPKAIGWVGLGLMGYPMAGNLLKKLSSDTHFYVYDVLPEALEKFVKDGDGRVDACATSREVADKSVRMPRSIVR